MVHGKLPLGRYLNSEFEKRDQFKIKFAFCRGEDMGCELFLERLKALLRIVKLGVMT